LSHSHCSLPRCQSCSLDTAATNTFPKTKLYQKGDAAVAPGDGKRAAKGTPHSPFEAVGPLFHQDGAKVPAGAQSYLEYEVR
jgi:hypothetical protein